MLLLCRPRQIPIPFVKKGIGFFEVTGKKFPKLQAAQSKRRRSRLTDVIDAMRLISWH
jgi:hypothetical protein